LNQSSPPSELDNGPETHIKQQIKNDALFIVESRSNCGFASETCTKQNKSQSSGCPLTTSRSGSIDGVSYRQQSIFGRCLFSEQSVPTHHLQIEQQSTDLVQVTTDRSSEQQTAGQRSARKDAEEQAD
jgi:hypothetical protein